MTVIAPIDVAERVEALDELRRARRSNHRRNIHWVDALYNVYLTAIGALVAVLVTASWIPEEKLDDAGVAGFISATPGWVGLAVAVAWAGGLRSGGRGGPLTLEPAVVFHELLGPVPRGPALRAPAMKLLRFAAFAGLLVGALVGVQATRRLPGNALVIVGCAALLGLALSTSTVGFAMLVSGRRVHRYVALTIGLVLVAWAIADLWFGTITSPTTMLATVAVWPEQFNAVAFVGLVLSGLAVAIGLSGIAGTSIESARRRAGLVSQLRFAVTLQDVRTVVLLRRQLNEEEPRARPWIRFAPKARSRVYPTWKRDLQGYLRFPITRVLRLVGLAVVAGLCLGFVWRGVPAAIVGAAAALFIAAYEANEPIGQEVDHPTRWYGPPVEPGSLLTRHLPGAIVLMLLECVLVAAAALILVPPGVVAQLAPIVIIPVAGGAAIGGAVATVTGLPGPTADFGRSGMSGVGDGMGGDIFGYQALARLLLPPAIVLAALAPLLAAGHDPDAIAQTAGRVSNLVSFSLVTTVAGFIYVRTRRPSRL